MDLMKAVMSVAKMVFLSVAMCVCVCVCVCICKEQEGHYLMGKFSFYFT